MTGLPLLWLAIVTSTAAWQKITSSDIRVGFVAGANDLAEKLASGVLPPDKIAIAPQLIFNQQLDAWITLFLVLILWVVILDMLRVCSRHLTGRSVRPVTESPHVPSRLVEEWVRD